VQSSVKLRTSSFFMLAESTPGSRSKKGMFDVHGCGVRWAWQGTEPLVEFRHGEISTAPC
jgi:hypothetical protein